MYARSIPKSLVSVAAGALFGLSLGCIITTSGGGSEECGSPFSHSHVGADDMCYCDSGYTWEDPNDNNNFDCEAIDPKDGQCDQPNSHELGGQCYCDAGFNWCSSDPNDFTCCPDDAQDTLAGTGDTGDVTMTDTGNDTGTDTGVDSSGGTVDDTGGVSPDPSQCNAENEGTYFCSNTGAMGPENSMMWQCLSGLWNLIGQPDLDALCMFDGYDFAYGCTDDGDVSGTAGPVCGYGPGTACEGDATACETDDLLNYCQYGKLSQSSCLAVCQDPMAKMTFDFGYCAEDPEAMGAFDCFCCDSGDEGCPQ